MFYIICDSEYHNDLYILFLVQIDKVVAALDGGTCDIALIDKDDLALFPGAQQNAVTDKGVHHVLQKDHDKPDIVFLHRLLLHRLNGPERGHGDMVGAVGCPGIIDVRDGHHLGKRIDAETGEPEGIAASVASFVMCQDRVFNVAVDIQVLTRRYPSRVCSLMAIFSSSV